MRVSLIQRLFFVSFLVVASFTMAAQAQREGSPLDHLTANVRQITSWGERPDFRQDGQRILFLSKVFGDVYEYEIATGRITPCTDHFKHHGFTRALYLSNGDVLLSGPVSSFDRTDKDARQKARSSSYLSVLDKSFTKPPVPLDEHCDEGPAVSRHRLRIAWTHGLQDRISTADLEYENGVPKLVNNRQVLQVSDFPEGSRPQRWFETQNFVPPHDKQLTVTVYELNGSANSEAFLLDLDSGALTNLSRSPDHYEEIEGIFPDGKHTLVERAEHHGNHWPLIDAWKLTLDGSGNAERLTFFTDFKGYKAGEPVVSEDGKHLAFTLGKSGMEAGQGFGLFLMELSGGQKDFLILYLSVQNRMPIHCPIALPRLSKAQFGKLDYAVMPHAFAAQKDFGCTHYFGNGHPVLLSGDLIRGALQGKPFWHAEAIGGPQWFRRKIGEPRPVMDELHDPVEICQQTQKAKDAKVPNR